jgi:hypothetical protein
MSAPRGLAWPRHANPRMTAAPPQKKNNKNLQSVPTGGKVSSASCPRSVGQLAARLRRAALPLSSPRGILCRDLCRNTSAACTLNRPAVPCATVPSFVPTTKPDRVGWSVTVSLESLAGQGICGIPSQLVTFRLSRWFFVRPVLGRRGSAVQIRAPRPISQLDPATCRPQPVSEPPCSARPRRSCDRTFSARPFC